ncbi:GPW/gp25 family protein [Streptomyces sp. P17]|uniref:GPW/gp25 family protein n=1 Tax=Streptomyces sp. P17 TaxID=3074716 RepID=UPI0028F3EBB8|nr:GPW/gp25 family protein [Streptomyces sp. P17]MDT9694962.1 GPW/gp25 family protein [Streptomyces sp. P17]
MSGDYPHVGRGWAFPPTWARPESGPVSLVTEDGKDHLADALVVLLHTTPGSRVMRPDFGAAVDRYVFEPRTPDACHRLADDVLRALLLGEPRVIVDSVEAVPSKEADDRVDVIVSYRIDRHRRPNNLVVPFYVAGGR